MEVMENKIVETGEEKYIILVWLNLMHNTGKLDDNQFIDEIKTLIRR